MYPSRRGWATRTPRLLALSTALAIALSSSAPAAAQERKQARTPTLAVAL
jgi:hypothetical protein